MIFTRLQVVLFFIVLLVISVSLFPSEYTRGLMLRQDGDRSDSISFFRSYLQRHPYHKGATLALANAYEESGEPEMGVGLMLAFYRNRRGDIETGRKVLDLMERCGMSRRRSAFRWELVVDVKKLPVFQEEALESLLYQAYQEAAARQNDEETVRALAELSRLQGKGESYRTEMLRLMLARGKLGQALKLLETISAEEPGNVNVMRTIVKIHLMRRHDGRALTVLGRALERLPNDKDLRSDRGGVYVKLERWEEALKDFEVLMRQEPEKVLWMREAGNCHIRLGRLDEGIDLYKKALMRRPWNRKIWWDIIYVYSDRKNHQKAAGHLEAYVRRFPSDKQGMKALIYAYEQLGREDKVIEILERWVRNAPDDRATRKLLSGLLRNQGSRLLKKGKENEGLALFDKALQMHQEDQPLWWDVIWAYVNRKRYVEASRWMQAFRKRWPEDPRAFEVMIHINNKLGRIDESLELLEKRTAEFPDEPGVRRDVIDLLRNEEMYAEAVPHYLALIRLEPEDDKVPRDLAYVYALLREYGKASELYAAYLKDHPEDYRSMDKYVELLVKAGQREKAAAVLRGYFGLRQPLSAPVNAGPRRGAAR